MSEYYVHENGTAADKASATGDGGLETFMNVATFNGETIPDNSVVYLSAGATITSKIVPPNNATNVITLRNIESESPVVDVGGIVDYALHHVRNNWVIQGIEFKNATSYGIFIGAGSGSIINECNISNAGVDGIRIQGTASISIKNSIINNITEVGIRSYSSGTVNIENSEVSYCDLDGIAGNKGITNILRCIVHNNGGAISHSGDGITGHVSAELNCYYNVVYNNFKSGFAFAEASTGTIYGNTVFDNIDATNNNAWGNENGMGIGINSTGNWSIKNNILSNNGDNIVITATAIAGSPVLNIDNNIYYSSIGATQYHWNGHDSDSLTAFVSDANDDVYTIDGNSSDSNPLISSTGKLSPSSPAIDAGTIIAGVSDIGQLDPWGSVSGPTPNIGADQSSNQNFISIDAGFNPNAITKVEIYG